MTIANVQSYGNVFNPLQTGVAHLYPPENRKPEGFLMFSGGIDMQHGAVMC